MANLKDLPSDILMDIITRLPTESILDCKLVCKPLRNLVSHHPSFTQMHLNRINNSADSGELSFLLLPENQYLYYFEYNENQDQKPRTRRINLTLPFAFHYIIVGSVNGLVCLYGCKEDKIRHPDGIPTQDVVLCICNPLTKEYVMLPEIERCCDDKYIRWSIGFGYVSSTNEYKVVAMYKLMTDLNVLVVAVYTLGTGIGWRNVGRFEVYVGKNHDERGAFANGVLHFWRDKREGKMLAFDLTEEKFYEHLSEPPVPPECTRWERYTIGVLSGFFYYSIKSRCYFTGFSDTDIWLLRNKSDTADMKEQVGWSKEVSLGDMEVEPVALTKSGGVLCSSNMSLGFYLETSCGFESFGFSYSNIPSQDHLNIVERIRRTRCSSNEVS